MLYRAPIALKFQENIFQDLYKCVLDSGHTIYPLMVPTPLKMSCGTNRPSRSFKISSTTDILSTILSSIRLRFKSRMNYPLENPNKHHFNSSGPYNHMYGFPISNFPTLFFLHFLKDDLNSTYDSFSSHSYSLHQLVTSRWDDNNEFHISHHGELVGTGRIHPDYFGIP